MNKKKRKDSLGKRSLAAALIMVMTATLLTWALPKDMSNVQAAPLPSNPHANSSGVMTWDCVYFGRYPQSDATGATSDPIKWRVLSVNENDAFLVADCNLDAWQYNNKSTEITWETSTIRSWLNGYANYYNTSKLDYRNKGFINNAFTVSEQEAILPVKIVNTGNPDSRYTEETTSSNTTDKIFLLSYEEVTNPAYGFSADDEGDPAKKRINTAFVGAGGSAESKNTNPAGSNGWWWLRTPGYYMNNAMFVTASGAPDREGTYVESNKYAVCPALHLNLSSSTLWSYAGTINSNGESTAGEEPPTGDNNPPPEQCKHENAEVRNDREPSCTETGYTGDTYCSKCGIKIGDGQSISAKGHQWNAGVVTKPATATEDGVKTFTCTVCSANKTVVINATGQPANPGTTNGNSTEEKNPPVIDGNNPEKEKPPVIDGNNPEKEKPPVGEDDSSNKDNNLSEEQDENTEVKKPKKGDVRTDFVSKAKYKVTQADSKARTVEYVAPESGLTKPIIPNTITIDGAAYKVTSIANNAFKNNKKIEKITIPSNVSKVGKQAFYGCKNLKNITIKTTKLTNKKIGSNAFKGIYSKAVVKVPKSKLAAYKKWLKKKGVPSKAKITK